MPTNVTPQYRKVESQFREATTTQQKIAALQEMLSIMPKHKGTDHLRAQHLQSDNLWFRLSPLSLVTVR